MLQQVMQSITASSKGVATGCGCAFHKNLA